MGVRFARPRGAVLTTVVIGLVVHVLGCGWHVAVIGGFGGTIGTGNLWRELFGGALLITPLVALALISWMIAALVINGQRQRRLDRGACPTCGYEGIALGVRCTECGAINPGPWPNTIERWARKAIAGLVLSTLAAVPVGQAWIELEEQLFVRQAERAAAAGATSIRRARSWPAHGGMMGWSETEGYWTHD